MDIKRIITAVAAGIGAHQKKVQVVFFRGKTPHAQENAIFIPLSVCEDRSLLNKGIAYCIHEVGHTVFSNYERWYLDRMKQVKGLAKLENILEDAVVEARMIDNHPGAMLFLAPLMEEFLPGVWQKNSASSLHTAVFTHCMMHSRAQVYPGLQVAAELRNQSRASVETFSSAEFADLLEAEIDGPGNSLERGERILALLAEEEEKGHEESSPQSNPSEGEESGEESTDTQSQDGDSEESQQTSGTGDEGTEADETNGGGDSQQPTSNHSGDEAGEGEESGEESTDTQSQEGDSEESQQTSGTGDEGTEADELAAQNYDFATWLMSSAPSTENEPPLTVAIASSKNQAIRPNTALLGVAEELTASYARKTGAVKKGKGQAIRTNSLALAGAGAPVFGRRSTVPGSSAHYVLLLDQSGSMTDIWGSAVECTMTMANAMEKVGDVQVDVMTYYRNYTCEGDPPVFVQRDCRITHVVDRKRYPDIAPDGTTPTAEALEYAWGVLRGSLYPRKGIIVITDGIADTQHPDLSRQIEADGINLYAIGLEVTNPSFLAHNFSRWVTSSIAELPTRLMSVLATAA